MVWAECVGVQAIAASLLDSAQPAQPAGSVLGQCSSDLKSALQPSNAEEAEKQLQAVLQASMDPSNNASAADTQDDELQKAIAVRWPGRPHETSLAGEPGPAARHPSRDAAIYLGRDSQVAAPRAGAECRAGPRTRR